MGMGEPLANYAQVVRALEILTDGDWGLGISPRRVTLSTVGLVPQIQKLMEETRVNLAISLHAPNDELRGQLMPINRKYPLKQVLDCCRALPLPRRKRITFEYVLLRGVNDSETDARQLAMLLRGIPSKVNVIPFNPHPGSKYTRPDGSARPRDFKWPCATRACKSMCAGRAATTFKQLAGNFKAKAVDAAGAARNDCSRGASVDLWPTRSSALSAAAGCITWRVFSACAKWPSRRRSESRPII